MEVKKKKLKHFIIRVRGKLVNGLIFKFKINQNGIIIRRGIFELFHFD